MKMGFIGAGRVGTALAIGLSRKGFSVQAVYDVEEDSASFFADSITGCAVMKGPQEVVDSCDFVVVSTPDAHIQPVVSELRWKDGQIVVHCSGANTVDLLETARKAGALVGVFHPGQSFADKKQAVENIAGATFDIEGEALVLDALKAMAAALDGNWIEIKAEDKAVYHVAVEFASLFVMLLFRLAETMMREIGVETVQAVRLAVPMVRGTANIIENFQISRPLTGPVDRGDTDTVKKHIDGMQRVCPRILPLYRELVRQNIPFAVLHESINEDKAKELFDLINEYNTKD